MRRRDSWSAEEETMLAELYPTESAEMVARLLDIRFGTKRTPCAVKGRARLLKIGKK